MLCNKLDVSTFGTVNLQTNKNIGGLRYMYKVVNEFKKGYLLRANSEKM
jgi:hypothetical protein